MAKSTVKAVTNIFQILELLRNLKSEESWVTFYVKGYESRWIQFTGSELNAAYPFDIIPSKIKKH